MVVDLNVHVGMAAALCDVGSSERVVRGGIWRIRAARHRTRDGAGLGASGRIAAARRGVAHASSVVQPLAPQARKRRSPSLRQRVALSDFRHTPLFYAIGQTLVLWDLHGGGPSNDGSGSTGAICADGSRPSAALKRSMALASLAHDQPDWAWPIVERGRDRIAAEDLGHPLLRDAVRVTNDVTIGPPGTFLLITGSNMAGKSTLLRTIGLNAILAHAGAPVCARRLTMPLLTRIPACA